MLKSKGNPLTVLATFIATAVVAEDMQLHPVLVVSMAGGLAYLALLFRNCVTFSSPRKPTRKVSA